MKSFTTKLRGSEFRILRLHDAPALTPPVTDTPEAVWSYLQLQLPESPIFQPDVENFIVILLNTRRRPTCWTVISQGTLDTILVHPREVFKAAIVANAAAMILAHNHPSGDPTPSEADIEVTRDLIRAGQLLQIEVLDHIILGRSTPERSQPWISLRELGYFYT